MGRKTVSHLLQAAPGDAEGATQLIPIRGELSNRLEILGRGAGAGLFEETALVAGEHLSGLEFSDVVGQLLVMELGNILGR